MTMKQSKLNRWERYFRCAFRWYLDRISVW